MSHMLLSNRNAFSFFFKHSAVICVCLIKTPTGKYVVYSSVLPTRKLEDKEHEEALKFGYSMQGIWADLGIKFKHSYGLPW